LKKSYKNEKNDHRPPTLIDTSKMKTRDFVYVQSDAAGSIPFFDFLKFRC